MARTSASKGRRSVKAARGGAGTAAKRTRRASKKVAAAGARKKATRASAGRRAPAKAAARGPGEPRARKRTAAPMDQEAMMAAWQQAMTPGAGHQRLDPIVGSWRTRTTMTMAPGAPPEVTEGTSEHRWVLGGRYVEQVYTGSAMGMPFEGLGYTGYDNVQRKYVGTWMDTFGTGLMNSSGSGKPTDSEMAFDAQVADPSGSVARFQCVLRIQDEDHHTYEMWTKAPNGRRFRTTLVEYTRGS